MAATPGFDGKTGAGLRDAVAASSQPRQHVAPTWQTLVATDGDTDGQRVWDPFTGAWLGQASWREGWWHSLVPYSWWEKGGEAVWHDLHNVRPCRLGVGDILADYPPGQGLSEVWWTNGVYSLGVGLVAGMESDLCEPPAQMRGDVARALMYMATVHCTSWLAPRGFMVMTGNAHPALTPYAQRLLMQWHREDPVSPDEVRRNREVERLQGNANPFVDYPELAEYLWGDLQGEVFVIPGEPVPLHGTYHLADGQVDFVTPFAPDGSRWRVDGREVDGLSVPTAQLGVGSHEVSFTSATRKGRVMIQILP